MTCRGLHQPGMKFHPQTPALRLLRQHVLPSGERAEPPHPGIPPPEGFAMRAHGLAPMVPPRPTGQLFLLVPLISAPSPAAA